MPPAPHRDLALDQVENKPSSSENEATIPPLWLPRLWRTVDSAVVFTTKVFLAATGLTFTVMVLLDVGSRLLLGSSIPEANSIARFLLVWFFMIGSGLALRKGAHMGLELLVRSMPTLLSKCAAILVGLILLAFFGIMMAAGWSAFVASLKQRDAALQVSMGWVMLAYPVGFSLLMYHQFAMLADRLTQYRERSRP